MSSKPKTDNLDQAVEALTQAEIFSADLETTGLSATVDRIKGISLSVGMRANQSWYFPFISFGTNFPIVSTLRALEPVFNDSKKIWVNSHIKFDLKFLMVNGLSTTCRLADTMIAHWMLDENARRHGLKEIVEEEFGVEMMTHKEAIATEGNLPFSGEHGDQFSKYAKDDARFARKLWVDAFAPRIEKEGLGPAFFNVEMPLIRVLADMELAGVAVNGEYLQEYGERLKLEISKQRAAAIQAVGRDFDPASSKQVSVALFEWLDLPRTSGTRKGKSGVYSTDDDALSAYGDHPAVGAILAFRGASKLLNTYVDPTLERLKVEPRIHPSFLQHGTVTGRLSSRDPNAQNLPAGKGSIRKSFIAPEGFTFLDVDFNQIEFRIAGHFASHFLGWSNIADAYARGLDLHEQTMKDLRFDRQVVELLNLGADPKGLEVKGAAKEARRKAKEINFGFIYGRGYQAFAEERGMSTDLAKQWRDQFHRAYPELKKLHDVCSEMIRQNGYITTLTRRRRRFPEWKGVTDELLEKRAREEGWSDEILDSKKRARWWASWVGWNAMVQGCQSLDGQILTSTGYKSLRDIDPNQDVLETPYGSVTHFTVHDAGVKAGFEVQTTAGFGTFSAEHRFGVYHNGRVEYERLSEIRVGDWVLGADAHVFSGNEAPCGELEAYLIGVLIGDGSYSSSQATVSFASGKSLKYREYLTWVVREAWGAPLTWSRSWGSRGVCWRAGICRVSVRERLLQLGLERVSKTNKSIPAWVFSATIYLRTAVLRGLMDTDGGFTGNRIVFTQKGRGVAEGVWRLLETLGIRARLSKQRTCWRVFVDPECVEQYRERVGFAVPEKQERLEKLENGRGWLPPALVSQIGDFILKQGETRELRPIRVRTDLVLDGQKHERVSTMQKRVLFTDGEFHLLHRLRDGSGSRTSCLEMLARLSDSERGNELMGLARMRWEQITKITPIGPVRMGDIETFEENHTYVGSGLSQHNSMADYVKVTMRNLWRALKERALADSRWDSVRVLLQVHDELLIEVPDEMVDEVEKLVIEIGESAMALKVKIKLESRRGKNWEEAG